MSAPAARRLMYSPREVSDRTGCPYETVLGHIHSGELEAVRRGKRWAIPLHAVKKYVRWPEDQEWPD